MQPTIVEVSVKDLTGSGSICCPSPQAGMQIREGHPRQYLDLAHDGRAVCPYCGTIYQLKSGEHFRPH